MEKKRTPILPIIIAAVIIGGIKMCNIQKDSEKRQQEIQESLNNSFRKYYEQNNELKSLPGMNYSDFLSPKSQATLDSIQRVMEEAETK